ncbi:hypothetical protein LZ30DRAFT_226383 [Colletotrichum cereale]|nr:hypothetical protein LZ30DRAFT_226383 [Colletotrichum cereale]
MPNRPTRVLITFCVVYLHFRETKTSPAGPGLARLRIPHHEDRFAPPSHTPECPEAAAAHATPRYSLVCQHPTQRDRLASTSVRSGPVSPGVALRHETLRRPIKSAPLASSAVLQNRNYFTKSNGYRIQTSSIRVGGSQRPPMSVRPETGSC